MFNNLFPKIVSFYEIMWKNIVKPDRPRLTIWRMRIACWINKSTDTQSEYVLLTVLTRRECLRKSVPMVRYA